MKKRLRFQFLVVFLLLLIASAGTIISQEQTGKIDRIVGDLVYVSGLETSIDSRLVLPDSEPRINLQVIKVLDEVVIARVLDGNDHSLKPDDRVLVNPEEAPPLERRIAHAVRVGLGPNLDGHLNDEAWKRAAPVEGLVQRNPSYWMPISDRTIVRIVYDNDKIYFGFECHSDPDQIVTNNMRRDSDISGDDHIQVLLDPYNDRQTGVFFFVNALGARRDLLLSNEGRTNNEDWDCIWEARTQRHDWGWSAEVAIPFDQLRFNEEEEMVWGLNVGRYIASRNEETALIVGRYSPSPRSKYWMSDLGTLHGLKAVERKRLLQVKPYLLPGTSKNFVGIDTSENESFETGVDVRYGITPNLSLDLSYNTDFAQVEADQEQVNLTQFSLFFPEKREFFLEGASLFDFGEPAEVRGGDSRPPTILFYSRRIGLESGQPVPILLGSKLAGKAGRTSIGALNALTDSERLQDGTDLPKSNFSILRVKQDVLERSNVGFIFVNKQTELNGAGWDRHNRAGGIDFSYSPSSELNVTGFVSRTWDSVIGDPDDARFIRADYQGSRYVWRFSYMDIEENFEPSAGFVNRRRGLRGFRRYDGRFWIIPRLRKWNLRNFRFGPNFQIMTDRENEVQFARFRYDHVTAFQTGDRILARMETVHDVVTRPFSPSSRRPDVSIDPGDYTFTTFRLGPDTANYRKWGVNVALEAGSYYTGNRFRFNGEVTYRPNGRFAIETVYDTNWIRLPEANLNITTVSNRLLYSLSTDFFLKLFAQWNNDAQLVGTNFLLNYRFRPGSDIFFVYDHGFDTLGGLEQRNRSAILKLSYLIGL